MADALWHGPELDQAEESSEPPEGMGVCLTALRSRTDEVIDGQLKEFGPGGELFDATKAELLKAGLPFDHDTVLALNLRSAIGAAYTYGLAVGIQLAAIDKSTEDDHRG